MAGDSQRQKFTFEYLEGKTFSSLTKKEFCENLEKWGMAGRLHAQTYTFDQQYKGYLVQDFALEFFQDERVVRTLKTVTNQGSIGLLGIKPSRVAAEAVPCTFVSMSLFDKLVEEEIVRDNGSIHKCLDEYVDGVCIADELRQVLLNEEFDKYGIYTESERSEFLFRLFSHICIGGGVCQYEDVVTPYLDLTKQLYKDLISVQKDSSSADLHVISSVFKIHAYDGDFLIYPDDDHINTFAYLIVDPLKRHATVLFHKYGGGLF